MAMGSFRSRGSTGREPQEWAVVWGLYTQQEPHEQEVLCYELLRMPAQKINRYLLQLVYLAVCRPCGPLERAVTQLCGRSFNIAVQVSWLLLALLQDQPWNRHIYQFREACERAVLTGDMGDEQLHLSPFLEQSLQDCFPQQQQPEKSHILQPLQQPNQLTASWGGSRSYMLTNRLTASTSSPPSPSVAAVMASSPAGHSPGAASFCALSSSSSSGAHRFRSSLDLELMRHASQDRAPSPALAGTPAPSVGCGPAVAAVPEAGEAAGVADPGTLTAATAKCCGSDQDQQAQQQQPAAMSGGLAKQLAASPAGCSQSSNGAGVSGSAAARLDEGQCTAAASTGSEIKSGAGAGSCGVSQRVAEPAQAGSAAAASCCGSFEEYVAARRVELQQELGEGEGVSSLIAASHEFAQHCGHQGLAWIVTHEEDLPELLSGSALLARPPTSPEHAAVRDSYLATLDFVAALCETSSNLTRFSHDQRRKVLRQCLARISMEVDAAAEQGVAVRYPIGGCCKRVLRLLAADAAILNSRDKQLQQPMHLTGAARTRQQQTQEEQEDAADALWLFGEVPASSSTDTLAKAASAALHSSSAGLWSAQTAEQGCEQQAVQVVLEVLAGPPAVPQLSKVNGALRIRRRLPSQEAIDIIAGQQADVLPHPSWQSGAQRFLYVVDGCCTRPFGAGQQDPQPVISLSLEQEKQAAAAAAAAAAERSKQAAAAFGERLSDRAARVAAASSYSSLPGWQLTGVIVKSGDDCRQELLALQLIREFRDIWAAAGIPLWVLPFEVLVTSSNTALIQLIADATSIHTIKARTSTALVGTAANSSSRNLPHGAAAATIPAGSAGTGTKGCVSLSDHFFAMWPRGSPECLAAQRRFVESLAGYSLMMHLLQVKDRHNGNIMMDDQGHLIHIDFGFILSNAPGGNWVRFEASPMKLTRELLEVMDSNSEGQPSDLFDYFKVLCIQGFLAARKERSRIVGLVQIMAQCCQGGPLCPSAAGGIPRAAEDQQAKGASGDGTVEEAAWRGVGSPLTAGAPPCSRPWPCFQAGPDKVVAALESRFMPGLSEGACVQHVLQLISSSLDAWSTRQYDYYQRVLNGIL
eukprot:gene3444-3715_t